MLPLSYASLGIHFQVSLWTNAREPTVPPFFTAMSN